MHRRLYLAVICASLISCAGTIDKYNGEAYKQVTIAKADVLHLMTKATTPYDSNLVDIETVFKEVNRAYQYDLGRPLNRVTMQMWDMIRDPTQDTYAGFLRIWKARGTLPQPFIDQEQIVIGDAFAQIAELESRKRK